MTNTATLNTSNKDTNNYGKIKYGLKTRERELERERENVTTPHPTPHPLCYSVCFCLAKIKILCLISVPLGRK